MSGSGSNRRWSRTERGRVHAGWKRAGVAFMPPVPAGPHRYQGRHQGGWLAVDPARGDALERAGHVTPEQAEDFRLYGAIGSHLENLERNDGFKGFNQPGIDGVLKIIDPRKNLVGAPGV